MTATFAIQLDGQWRDVEVSDLTWTKTAPGGCLSAQATIKDPFAADQVRTDDRVLISHPATGRVLFDGAIRDPGQRSRLGLRDGQVTISGSLLDLAGRRWRLPYKVQGPGDWVREDLVLEFFGSPSRDRQHGDVSVGTTVDGAAQTVESLRLGLTGETLRYDKARARLTAFDGGSDSTVAYYKLDYTSGFSAGVAVNWRFRVVIGDPVDLDWPIDEAPDIWSPSRSGQAGVTADFPAGEQNIRVELEYIDTPALDISQSSYRVNVSNMSVLGSRVDLAGAPATVSSDLLSVTQVVSDLAGRSGIIDAERSYVDSGFSALDDCRIDGSVLSGLNDMLELDFGKTYVLGAAREATKHPFSWREWGAPRYVLSQERGEYTEQPRDDEVCSRVIVRWRWAAGMWASPEIAVADPDIYPATRTLIESGRHRDAEEIELPQGTTRAQGQRVAEQRLEQVASVTVSATFGTSQQVLDLHTGVLVDPTEVEPGWVALIQETGEQHNITQAVYDGMNDTVNLTLGQPVRGLEERVTAMRKTQRGSR